MRCPPLRGGEMCVWFVGRTGPWEDNSRMHILAAIMLLPQRTARGRKFDVSQQCSPPPNSSAPQQTFED